MTMAAVGTFGAGDLSRRAAGIGPRLFRETGFHQKTTLIAHPLSFLVTRRITLSRASNASQAMLAPLFHPSVTLRLVTQEPFDLHEYADPATVSVQY